MRRSLTAQLEIDLGGFILEVFLETEFGHTLLRIQIGGILEHDFLIDFECFLALLLLKIMLSQGQIVLDRAAEQSALGIQIAKMTIDFIAGRIYLENLFVGGNRF